MKKIIFFLIPTLLIVVIATAFGFKKEDLGETTKAPRKIKTTAPEQLDFQETIYGSGQLASREELKLSFKTGGIIQKIMVNEGQYVKKGQLLAVLNLQEIDAQVQQAAIGQQQAEITIDNAELALKIAERDYRNALGLYQDSVATLEQLENAELQRDNARNQLEAARNGLSFSERSREIANFNLTHSRIVAPANGLVLRKLAEANELVGPGNPIFIFGSQDKAQVIRVSLTDKDIIHVNLQDSAKISFDAYPREQFHGTVQEIASIADPYTGTYEVEIEVNPNGKKLLSGFIGQVYIQTRSTQSLLSIPVDALVSADQNRAVIFTVKDNQAERREVAIFRLEADHLLIKDGLSVNDAVVAQGANYLQDKETVSVEQ